MPVNVILVAEIFATCLKMRYFALYGIPNSINGIFCVKLIIFLLFLWFMIKKSPRSFEEVFQELLK